MTTESTNELLGLYLTPAGIAPPPKRELRTYETMARVEGHPPSQTERTGSEGLWNRENHVPETDGTRGRVVGSRQRRSENKVRNSGRWDTKELHRNEPQRHLVP